MEIVNIILIIVFSIVGIYLIYKASKFFTKPKIDCSGYPIMNTVLSTYFSTQYASKIAQSLACCYIDIMKKLYTDADMKAFENLAATNATQFNFEFATLIVPTITKSGYKCS